MLSGTAVWLSDEHNISILSTGADPQIYLNTIPRLPEVPLELQLWIKAERDLNSVSREMASRRDAAQAEVVTLREALALAERAGQERAVAAEVVQADVVALQGTLTAAREVGKAAIAALRIDTAVLAKPDGSRGWRQLAMRFLAPEPG